jgi:acyl-CoA reductase-like NAD-dependent aldehyde dehydrogenase
VKPNLPHIPAIRLGRAYESLDAVELADFRNGKPVVRVSQVNAGIVRRDLQRMGEAREALGSLPTQRLIEICARAGELFLAAPLPLGNGTQSPQEYIEALSATSGLPHALCRRNMAKIHDVLTNMPAILRGQTRGLDLGVLDAGIGEQSGVRVSFYAATNCLGVVLPSNSPGVNSLWLPAIALKIPVVLKPGREEPWTPCRIIQAFLAAGCPPEAFGFYPTDHEGANAILQGCGRALIFGDKSTVEQYAGKPNIQVHGPGFSKVLIGADEIERWPEFLDVLASSIAENGGRSCINASAIVVPGHAREIADALAKRLGPIQPLPSDDPNAQLAGFANPQFAGYMDGAIEEGLRTPGAEDATATYRGGPRKVTFEGATYLRPTIVLCDSFAHPLANREFLFPYASVVEVPQEKMLEQIGPSLVVTAITRDEQFIRPLLGSPLVDRLNLGPIATTKVSWDQPHEGNLFEFLYKRRAIERAK